MEKKRGKGRPTIAETIAGDNASHYEYVLTGGRKYRSRRSVADTIYAFTAASVLTESASESKDLETIFGPDSMSRSILNQLGRMIRIERYSENDVIEIAKEAIQAKKNGHSVKDIEKYIRHGRMTGKW